MQVTLVGTLLRIQWQPLPADIDAEVVRRIQGIESATRSNRYPRTWYVFPAQLDTLMQTFPKASYAPEVIALYPVQVPEPQPVQGALIDTGDRVFEWQRKGKRQKTSNRKGTQHG